MFGGFGNQSDNGAAIEKLVLAVVVFLTMLVLGIGDDSGWKGGLVFGKPEIVDWSPNVPGHSGDNQTKQMFHIGIILTISCPSFNPDETWISFGVSNHGRKALGIGPGGIVLVPALPAQIMQCKTIKTGGLFGNEHSLLMVDTGKSEADIIASFDPASKSDRVVVLIQMKRMLSANLEFRIPFDLGGS